jgi:hypothetical protein
MVSVTKVLNLNIVYIISLLISIKYSMYVLDLHLLKGNSSLFVRGGGGGVQILIK